MKGHETGNNITKMRGGTLEELVLSRGSMTGILSSDLFGSVTLAIAGTIKAAVRFLGLAVRATAVRRACVSETMQHTIGAVTHLSHSGHLPCSMRPPATMCGA